MASAPNESRPSSSTTPEPSTSSARNSAGDRLLQARRRGGLPALPRLGLPRHGLRAAGQLDPAIEAYRKCIDIAPEYHKAFNNVGELYRRKGLLDYAAMVFKMATEIEPKISHYFYNLGITYFEIGMYKQAEEAFSKAVALDGNDYEYATELAQVQFTQKDYEGALNTLSRFHDAHPEQARAAETGARVQMLRRRLEQLKAAVPTTDMKGETRRVALEEDDENAKTKMVGPVVPPGQNDPPSPPK